MGSCLDLLRLLWWWTRSLHGIVVIANVIPQLIVSLVSGPWDEVFRGGNLPSFIVGAVAETLSRIFALTLLSAPNNSKDSPSSSDVSKIDVASSHSKSMQTNV